MGTSSDRQHVVGLDEVGAGDLPTVGGKAANLGELVRAGLPVPPGFVVTTGAYVTVIRGAALTDTLTDPGTSPAVLRRAIEAVDVPAGVRDAVVAAYARLGSDVPVAVRSSATAEDLPGSAFAGQQDTYLNVVGAEAVVDAVRRCWASLWTDRAVAYRHDRSIDPSEVRIAVVVQTMVESEVAGVMFTADPVSGARDRILVDAGTGLGEAVVAGLVTPDHYVLDRRGRLLERTPGRGEVVVRPTAGGGVHHVTGADASTGAPLLGGDELSTLAAHGRTIAEHFGRPQDVEWALAGGHVLVVQARPMTALPPPSVPLNRRQRLQAAILTEYLPVRPYPMDVTTLVERGPARMMSEIGRHYGVVGLFEGFLREEDGVAVQILPSSPRPTLRTVAGVGRAARRVRRFRPADWATDPRHEAFLTEVGALETLDLGALPWAELVTVPERALAAQDHCRDLRIDYLPGAVAALVRLVVNVTLLGRRHMVADLVGGVRTRTEEATDALAALADEIRGDSGLRALVTGQEPSHVLGALEREDRFGWFRAHVDTFLDEYGRRETVSPLLVSPPTLAESPEIVLGMVQSLVTQPPRESEAVSRSATALARLMQHPWLRRSTRRQERVRRRVRAAREAAAFREDTHFFFTAALPTLRRALLEIGRRLHAVGLLTEPSDVFHLRWEEVSDLEDPSATTERTDELRSRVGLRSARRAELAGVPMIDPRRVFPTAATGDAVVTGAPAGAGTATGVARVVRGPEEFDRLGDGEILVCPYTNPAWTPLFRRAAAVVVDTGSPASHAAIVAREYGIPAVTGTATGTSALTDGETITVDGGLGLVTREGGA